MSSTEHSTERVVELLRRAAPPPGGHELRWVGRWDGSHAGQPFVSYLSGPVEVNWSQCLERLHADEGRDHFLDVWTRTAALDLLAEVRPGSLLDLGCSSGAFLEDARRRWHDIVLVGVDLEAEGLIKAHAALPDVPLLQASATSLPFAEGSFEAVASLNVLEHLPDDLAALREIRRVLRRGGKAVLVVPASPTLYDYYDSFLQHERRYSRDELNDKIGSSGLRLIRSTSLGGFIYPAFWVVKKRNRRRYRDPRSVDGARLVASDIRATRASSLGRRTCVWERWLLRHRVDLPVGIRAVAVVERP